MDDYFLEGEGGNHALAKTLRAKGQFHLGPIDYAISQLVPILGNDETFKFYEDPVKTKQRVEAMYESYQNGWRPVPLIASNIWEDYYELMDGAHRLELLKKLGIETYPTIFFFRDQKSLDEYSV